MRKSLPWLLLALVLTSACTSPRARQAALAAKPGWGRGFSPEQRELSVRAVPASSAPSAPVTRIGRPGWGSPVPVK